MKKFKKPDSSKLDKLVQNGQEKNLLSSLLGGSNGTSCGQTPLGYVHYADALYVRR
jgi:hypothetical protein